MMKKFKLEELNKINEVYQNYTYKGVLDIKQLNEVYTLITGKESNNIPKIAKFKAINTFYQFSYQDALNLAKQHDALDYLFDDKDEEINQEDEEINRNQVEKELTLTRIGDLEKELQQMNEDDPARRIVKMKLTKANKKLKDL